MPTVAGAATRIDLSVSVTTALQIPPGGTGAVAVTWRNAGPGTATGVNITYVPPTGAQLATTLPAGWSRAGRGAVRTVATMARGAGGSATLTVVVPKTAVPGGLLVGGYAQVSATGGTDSAPGNNEAASRIRVTAVAPSPTATPKPTPKPTPTNTAKASPTPSPSASPAPSRAPASPAPVRSAAAKPATVATTRPAAPRAGATNRTSAATRTAPSPTASTHVVRPSIDAGASPGVIEVVDSPRSGLSGAAVPLVGAAACFGAAGAGLVALRRRRLEARSDEEELRGLRQT